MSSYGLQIDHLAVRKGYKALNLITKGNSVKAGQLTSFSFTAPVGAKPVIFIKPINTGQGTAPHVLHQLNSTHWTAYFVGYVTAYVFTELAPSAKGGYGIEIYNDNGEVFFDSETIPAKPIKTVTVGSIAPDGRSNTITLPNPSQAAFNLHGNRMAFAVDMGTKQMHAWRDVVVRTSGGYYLESKKLLNRRWTSSDGSIFDFQKKLGNISNQFPVSLSFINVEGL